MQSNSIFKFIDRTALVPIIFFLVLFFNEGNIIPFQLNPDEGINLVKADLLNQSFEFIKEIWSDQPPFLSSLLGIIFNIVEDKVTTARYLIIGFSLLFISGFYRLLRAEFNFHIALIFTCLLIIQSQFATYTSQILVGLPAVALAIFSVSLIQRNQKQTFFIFLSAIFLGLGV